MRKIILTLLIVVNTVSCYSNTTKWDILMDAIIQVESKGNPRAVNGDQVGCMQIRPILVRDCNRILKLRKSTKRFSLKDRYSVAKSKEMFMLYQSYYNPKGNMERAIRLWCGGSNYSVKATQSYYNKVIRQMRKS